MEQRKITDDLQALLGVLPPDISQAVTAADDSDNLLEVILDDGEPIRNVPESLKNDGQTILAKDKIDENHYRLLIQKV